MNAVEEARKGYEEALKKRKRDRSPANQKRLRNERNQRFRERVIRQASGGAQACSFYLANILPGEPERVSPEDLEEIAVFLEAEGFTVSRRHKTTYINKPGYNKEYTSLVQITVWGWAP